MEVSDPVTGIREPTEDEKDEIWKAAVTDDVDTLYSLMQSNVNVTDAYITGLNQTALHIAASNGRNDVISALLNSGAKVNGATPTDQWTPLHCAASSGHIDTVALLVAKGADVYMKTKLGRTPLQYALRENRSDVVAYFINDIGMDQKEYDKETQQNIERLLEVAETGSGSMDRHAISPDPQESLRIMLTKLEQAKANNEILKVSYTTVLFSGSSGVGKTSLLNKLNKENLNRHHTSTGVAKSKHTVCIKTTAVVKCIEGLHWIDLDYDSMISHLSKHLHNLKFPSSTSLTAVSSKDNTPNTTGSENVIKRYNKAEVDVAKTDLGEVDIVNADLVSVDIAKANSSNIPSLGDVWDIINFLDTGGQPEFVNILPAISSSIALTFIVFNLSKSLDDFVHVQHNVNGDPSFEPYYLDCSNVEFIKRLIVSSENYLESIAPLKSIQRENGGSDPKLCYIGTHALNVSEKKVREIDDRLSSIANELELHQRSFWGSPKPQLMRLFPIDLFPIDEKESFEDIIEDIRDNIQKQVHKRDYYEVPITWFIFLLNMQRLCDTRNVSYISYDEAVDVWRGEDVTNNDWKTRSDLENQHPSASRDNSDVHNVLLFFHFMGMLFYYHEVKEICNFVFIDRQWLFEKLTELVETKYKMQYSKKDISAENYEKFTREGRLNINIITNLNINLQGIQPLFFIYLLNHLNIVTPIDLEKNDYFMPCVLPSFPLKHYSEKIIGFDKYYGTIQHVPLLVGFKNGPMPHGFFCHLIVELLRHLPKGWNPPLLSTSRMQHVYNNFITFFTTTGHGVSLFYKIGYLEVHVRHKQSQLNIHVDVRSELDRALRKICDHLHTSNEQLCYGFYCECEEIQHFAKLQTLNSPTEYISCNYSLTKLTKDHRVWLQEAKVCHNDFKQQVIARKEPTMKWMYKLVIPQVCAHWKKVAAFLEYPIAKKNEIEERHHGDPSNCCAELIEDWLTSNQGVSPKTWHSLLSVLKDIGELSSAAHCIEQCLINEGQLYKDGCC